MSIYCKFYDANQTFLSELECSNQTVSIPQNAVCGLFYDNSYKITGLTVEYDTINQTFNSAVVDHFLVVFPASQISLYASDVRSNQFMTEVPQLSQIEVEYLKSLASGSVDFSTIVNALNSIASALSALTNLSNLSNLTNLANLSDLANIITAIQNKDNQSDIVSIIRDLFFIRVSGSRYRSVFSGLLPNTNYPQWDSGDYTIPGLLNKIVRCLTSLNTDINSPASLLVNDVKFFSNINNRLQEIETKLEQNLPFSVLVQNDVVLSNPNETYRYIKDFEKIGFN